MSVPAHPRPERRSASASRSYRTRLPWQRGKPFRILSVDGGGIKGIFPAAILASIEDKLLAGQPISNYFDLACGTSTGGIIALGLGKRIPASDLLKLYLDKGNAIFPRAGWLEKLRRRLRAYVSYQYERNVLERELKAAFQDARLHESKMRLCVPAFEGHYGEIYVFKTPHHQDYKKDYNEPLVKVGLSTSAAPTYFTAYDRDGYRYLDGGVWANNPIMIAVVEALSCFDIHPTDIRILSLGCGADPFIVDDAKAFGGLLAWRRAIAAAMDLQSQSAIGQARLLVGPERVVRIEPTVAQPIPLDDWQRARTELPPLAEEAFIENSVQLREMFFGEQVDPPRFYWPQA
jgi:hypothetical protein